MDSWINTYKQLISVSHKPHVLVADRDNLARYEELKAALSADGFHLFVFESDLEVRMGFELKIKDKSIKAFIFAPSAYSPLPDMLEYVHFQSIGLSNLFPHFNSRAIKGLSSYSLNLLSKEKMYENLSYETTVAFLTKHIYQREQRLKTIIDELREKEELFEERYETWFELIPLFAEGKIEALKTQNKALIADFQEWECIFNQRFQSFIEKEYQNLFSFSAIKKPIVVSRILEHLKAQKAHKKALIVIDGMNYWQWLMLSKALSSVEISFQAGASFAYIPTITAWSRQAILRGEKPNLSQGNANESSLFTHFWLENGYKKQQITYKKFGVNAPLNENEISEYTEMLALVCNDLDEIMHGCVLGDEQLSESTQQWIQKIAFVEILLRLKKKGFKIYITSDHGNISANGMKNLSAMDKVGALSRSKRHLHFQSQLLLESFITQNQNLTFGVSNLSVYLKNKEAFIEPNKVVVTHGGSHFWEVLVPFIQII